MSVCIQDVLTLTAMIGSLCLCHSLLRLDTLANIVRTSFVITNLLISLNRTAGFAHFMKSNDGTRAVSKICCCRFFPYCF